MTESSSFTFSTATTLLLTIPPTIFLLLLFFSPTRVTASHTMSQRPCANSLLKVQNLLLGHAFTNWPSTLYAHLDHDVFTPPHGTVNAFSSSLSSTSSSQPRPPPPPPSPHQYNISGGRGQPVTHVTRRIKYQHTMT